MNSLIPSFIINISSRLFKLLFHKTKNHKVNIDYTTSNIHILIKTSFDKSSHFSFNSSQFSFGNVVPQETNDVVEAIEEPIESS